MKNLCVTLKSNKLNNVCEPGKRKNFLSQFQKEINGLTCGQLFMCMCIVTFLEGRKTTVILIFMPVQDQRYHGGGGAINMYSENPSK